MSGIGFGKDHGLIFALSSGSYQFSTTTNTPVAMDNGGIRYYFGSASKASLKKDAETEPKFLATGSTIENSVDWPYAPHPADNAGAAAIQSTYNTILAHQDSFMLGGAVPEQYFRVNAVYKVDGEGNPTTEVSRYKINENLMYRKVIGGNKIPFLGAKMPMRQPAISLIINKIRRVKKKCITFNPEISDYINQAWTFEDEWDYEEDGVEKTLKLVYVVLSLTDGTFQVFPLSAMDEFGDVHADFVKIVTPEYPEWVLPFVNIKEATEERDGKPPLQPIIPWSVDSTGKKIIGCLVERVTLEENIRTQILLGGSYPDFRSEEFDDSGRVKVFAEAAVFGSGDSEPLQVDRLGVVELEFTILRISEELSDFTCSVAVVRDTAPVDTSPMRMGIAYARPVVGTPVAVDSIVELYMSFYETEDQQRFHRALGGIYGGEVPQYGEWSIHVDGSPLLSFPMQAVLDSDNNPIEFGCLKNMIDATTIYTEIENLDLSTLSFYRTVRVRKPTLTRDVPRTSSGGYIGRINHLTKNCAVRIDAFVLGSIVETDSAGDSDLFPLIDTYLSPGFSSNIKSNLDECSPAQTYPIRGNYRTFLTWYSDSEVNWQSSDYPFLYQGQIPPQWWGHVMFWPLLYVFCEMDHKERGGDYSEGTGHGGGDHAGCNHAGCSGSMLPLGELNSGNFSAEYWDKVLAFNHATTDLSTIYALIIEARGDRVNNSFTWPINSMLKTANSDWDEGNPDYSDMKWLAEKAVLFAKEIFPGGSPVAFANHTVWSWSGLAYAFSIAFACYHASDGRWRNSTDAYFMLDTGYVKTISDHIVVNHYPWFWHFAIQNYNRLLVNNTRNDIMVHPNGHYSIMRDYLYCPTNSMPESELFSYTFGLAAANHPDDPITEYSTNFSDSALPTGVEYDGMYLDKLAFWGGATETSHIASYNFAFNKNENISQYYPNSTRFYEEVTEDEELIVVYGGYRYPAHNFNNPFMRFKLSNTANTFVKDFKVAMPFPRIAPLWGV